MFKRNPEINPGLFEGDMVGFDPKKMVNKLLSRLTSGFSQKNWMPYTNLTCKKQTVLFERDLMHVLKSAMRVIIL